MLLVVPVGSVPRFPSSIAAVSDASQRTARTPFGLPDASNFAEYPAAVPESLIACAMLLRLVDGSRPSVPSSVAVVPDASQRTATRPARLPTPTTVLELLMPYALLLTLSGRFSSCVGSVPDPSHRTRKLPDWLPAPSYLVAPPTTVPAGFTASTPHIV